MSAAIHRIPQQAPAMPTDPPPQPPASKKSPHRMNGRGSWTYPVHADCLLDMLRSATMLREKCEEPYSFEAACVSYMLDSDRGTVKREADYIRIWGWTRKQLRARWADLLGTVENWTSAYGRLGAESKGQTRANEGPDKGQEIPVIATDSPSKGQRRANEGPSEGQHTIQLPTPTPNPGGESIPVPTLEEVITHGSIIGIPRELCEEFFNHYAALLWYYRPERGDPISPGRWDWRPKLRGWQLRKLRDDRKPERQGGKGGRSGGAQTDEYGLLPYSAIAGMTTKENGLMDRCEWFKRTSDNALIGRETGTGLPVPESYARRTQS